MQSAVVGFAGMTLKAAATTQLGQVVNISSDDIYADSATPLTQASVKAPESLHGVLHLAREIMFASEIKTPLAMLRATLIYGAADPHTGFRPNRFLRLAAAGEPITLFGKGEERRDHVLIDDVAELTARLFIGVPPAQPRYPHDFGLPRDRRNRGRNVASAGADRGAAANRTDAAQRLSRA
jgi:nucleoside-diphosphate-sugar epimerase